MARRRHCATAHAALARVVIAVAALALPQLAAAKFSIESASARVVDGVVMLDANIDFDFNEVALEAMNNAVPITVAVDVEVLRRGSLWNKRVAELRLLFRVETHPLSEHYVVTQLNSGDARTYRSFAQMRSSLGRLTNVPLLDAYLLGSGARHSVRLRADLDVEALPAPMRPLVYVSGPWQMGSDWSELPLQP